MKKAVKIFFDLFFIGGGVLLVIFSFSRFNLSRTTSISEAYPPPTIIIDNNTVSTIPYPPPGEFKITPTPIESLNDPMCYIDKVNKFTIRLLPGWQADTPPDINAFGGASIFYNYNPKELKGNHGFYSLPPNAIKIQVTSAIIPKEQTFEEWVIESVNGIQSNDISKQYYNQLTTPLPYSISNLHGMSYTIIDKTGSNKLIIDINVDNKNVLIISISPATSPALLDALQMVSTINLIEINSCLPDVTIIEKEEIKIPIADINKINMSQMEFTCSLGSFPGVEAYNSQIQLQMPFPRGETWIVGGVGSFYGNYHHCNFYNNYYATDWNKAEGNDENAIVLSIADGVVSEVDTQCYSSYGCFVRVGHTDGYSSLYAHLNIIYVQEGMQILVGQALGRVGCTGTCDESHLHLSFFHWDRSEYPYYYSYFSQCYNSGQFCPNDEAPYFPQGYKPSPMWTAYGNTYISDGLAFTSVNGYVQFIPIIIND